jgi:hypothetical protein
MALRRAFLAAAIGAALAAPAARAADVITVSSTADSGPGTLRAALQNAKAGDEIVLPKGDYQVTSAELLVSKGITIQGAGARATILHGDSDNRVLNVTAGSLVTLSGLTITNGHAAGGGGIVADTPLHLTSVGLVGNVSTDNGGALVNDRAMTITSSLIANNSATNDGGGLELDDGNVDIVNSTFAANGAGGTGGAFNDSSGATPDTITLTHVTAADNSASQGGAFRNGSFNTVKYRNTVFASNTASSGTTCYQAGGAFNESLGGNRSAGDVTQCNLTGANDLNGATLNLGPLANNGGPTNTYQLGTGSQALNADPNDANCPSSDQRGVPRPEGSKCDAGALERSTPTASIGDTGGITATRATVPGLVVTQGLPAIATLRYGVTTAYGKTKSVLLLGVATVDNVPFPLKGLRPNTTYHARVAVTTPDGTGQSKDTTFKTLKRAKRCHVPKLKGLTLAKAKRKLKRAHCGLGKVRYRHSGHARRHPVVVKQSPKPGAVRHRGARVRVTLSRKQR